MTTLASSRPCFSRCSSSAISLHRLTAGDGEVGWRQDLIVEVFEVLHTLRVDDAHHRKQVAEDPDLRLTNVGQIDIEMGFLDHVDGQDAGPCPHPAQTSVRQLGLG